MAAPGVGPWQKVSVAALGDEPEGLGKDTNWEEQERIMEMAKRYYGANFLGLDPVSAISQDADADAQRPYPLQLERRPAPPQPQPRPQPQRRAASPPPQPDELEEYLVDAIDDVRATADGITYRLSPDLNDKSDDVADWGSTVKGCIRHNGWLKLEDGRYLPMVIAGTQVLHQTMSGADLDYGDPNYDPYGSSDDEEEGWEKDPLDRLFQSAERRVASAERHKSEASKRAREIALRSGGVRSGGGPTAGLLTSFSGGSSTGEASSGGQAAGSSSAARPSV